MTAVLLVFAMALSQAQAVSCGSWYSNPCLAEDDERYDLNGSDSIIDQAPIVWGNLEGFWSYEVKAYGPEGSPQEPTIANPNQPFLVGGFPYPYFPALGFLNVTIVGSRMYQHRYIVHPPAPVEFCNQDVIASFVNVLGNGRCGETGYSYFSETFGTSSFERDGTVIALPFDSNLGNGGLLRSSETYTSRPIDNRTIYAAAKDGSGNFLSETLVFLDSSHTQMSGVSEFYITLRDQARLAAFFRTEYSRLASANVFEASLQTTYEAYAVPLEDRVQVGQVPMETDCLAADCPTEEAWCTIDPLCASTPYNEPRGSIKAGTVAGFTVAGAALLIATLYLLHIHRLKRQEKRYRGKFAQQVADAIEVKESAYALEPEKLLYEFHQLDPALTDNVSGEKIRKDEMKGFMQSGVVGYITESDFGALWSAIDTDQSGYVDFLEFCAFLAQCHDEFKREHVNRESLAKLIAKRLSKLSMHAVSVRSTSLAAGMILDESLRDGRPESPTGTDESPPTVRSARSMGSGGFFDEPISQRMT